MNAIILGAGRGIRMMPETMDRPKCLVEGLGGRRLLDWSLDAFRKVGIQNIAFVGGYRIDQVSAAYPNLTYFNNTDWATSGNLASLFHAAPMMSDGFVVLYSDIVFQTSVLEQLLAEEAQVAVAVDHDWRNRWELGAIHNPNAELIKAKDGQVEAIGKKVTPDKAVGQFIGLAKIGKAAAAAMNERYRELSQRNGHSQFHEASSLKQASLTDMFQEMIDQGLHVKPIEIWGGWGELNTQDDLKWLRVQLDGFGERGLAKKFWAVRAERYQGLEWANRASYLDAFVTAGDFEPTDQVLDVGTGTGIVAKAIAPHVASVIGIDVSLDMLRNAEESNQLPNLRFEEGLAQSLQFADEIFDKVTARMVFHHLIHDGQIGMRECYRVLKPGGRLILSEGVPPDDSLQDWYTRMFALKEERLTFSETRLVELIESGGFQVNEVVTHWQRGVSIRNWLRNSGLPEERQAQIFQMHLDMDESGKRHYNMQLTDDDILCDFKFLILVGTK